MTRSCACDRLDNKRVRSLRGSRLVTRCTESLSFAMVRRHGGILDLNDLLSLVFVSARTIFLYFTAGERCGFSWGIIARLDSSSIVVVTRGFIVLIRFLVDKWE